MTHYVQPHPGWAGAEFAFAHKMGADLCAEFHLTVDEAGAAVAFYEAGNTLELEKLLASHAVAPEASAPVPVELVEEAKPTHGYDATPLHAYVFVKPVPKDHAGRLIVPAAFESTSDMGFVQSVGPDVTEVQPGMLVLYDRYAEVGNRFALVDSDGELVDLVQMRLDNITAIMKRVGL